jgi:DNA-binding CsgD family transcriptional regulator
MIKRGLSSKEIGKLLNISHRTAETHRNRIRKKLEIQDPAVNLQTYLKNL